MPVELSKDLTSALHSQDDDRLQVIDPETNRLYFIVDADTLNHLEQASAHEAIARGIEDLEAGRHRPLAEVDADIRKRFGFPPRQQS